MFTQVHQSFERTHRGLGIGLTLVRRLVEMHGGAVTANSQGEGRGSEFVVRLPSLVAAPVPSEPRPRPRIRGAKHSVTAFSSWMTIATPQSPWER
jgi:hypothetical protein